MLIQFAFMLTWQVKINLVYCAGVDVTLNRLTFGNCHLPLDTNELLMQPASLYVCPENVCVRALECGLQCAICN